jgi:hypothetical protein
MEDVAHNGVTSNAYNISAGMPDSRRPIGYPLSIYKGNIRMELI